MAARIDTVTGRAALKPRHAPYWQKVRTDCHLGFRKTTLESVGAWIARYRGSDGKYQLHSLGAVDSTGGADRFGAAVKLAIDWFDHIDKGGSTKSKTIAAVCQNYVDDQRSKKGDKPAFDAESRFKSYVLDDDRFAKLELTKLTPAHIDSWRKRLANRPVKQGTRGKKRKADGYALDKLKKLRTPSTLNRDMTPFRAALNLAFSDGWVTTDFAWRNKLKPLENADKKRDLYLDREQRVKFIEAAESSLALFLRGLCMMPVRPGALAALTVGDLDQRLMALKIKQDKTGSRTIKLPPATAALFKESAKSKLPNAPLFSRADGLAWTKDSWKYPVREAAKAAKMPVGTTAYTLRHSVISDLVHDGLDLLTVAQISGTSVRMIEQHYGHLRGDIAADALAKLAL